MCKICELKEDMGKAFIEMLSDVSRLGDMTIDAVGLLHKLKTRGVEFDKDEETLYSRLLAGVTGDDAQAAGTVTGDGTGQVSPEGMTERIAEAIASQMGIPVENIVICESPEQAAAMIAKLASEDGGNKKPH